MVSLCARIRDEIAVHDTMVHGLPRDAAGDLGHARWLALPGLRGRRVGRAHRAPVSLPGTHRWMNAENSNSHTELEERLRFETLIADLSSKFVNLPPDQVDGEIMDAERLIYRPEGGACFCFTVPVAHGNMKP